MLIELSEDEIKGILTYMYYGINECGEISNVEQSAYTKLYNYLKSNYEVPDYITEPTELTRYNVEAELNEE